MSEPYESMEQLGEAADTVSNLIAAMSVPLPPAMHLDGLRAELPKLRDKLRAIYTAETGDDPWGAGRE